MSKIDATPTGCPGPIPGTKVWRCDGTDCCYGPNNYASCKQEIAKRGYTLRLSNDIVSEMLMDKELTKACAQGKLKDTQGKLKDTKDLLDKVVGEKTELLQLLQQVTIAKDELLAYNCFLESEVLNAKNDASVTNNDGHDSDAMPDAIADTEVRNESTDSNEDSDSMDTVVSDSSSTGTGDASVIRTGEVTASGE